MFKLVYQFPHLSFHVVSYYFLDGENSLVLLEILLIYFLIFGLGNVLDRFFVL